MAPIANTIYFPLLEECLRGEKVILSWKLVATALSDPTGARQTSEAVREFLSDRHVQGFFEKPATAFAGLADDSSADFETRTSAIHVTPNPNGKYDIKTIKEDATWLSKNARINLITALRIAVVEFQSRPASHLQGPLSLQDAINLQDAAGENETQTSSLAAALGGPGSADADVIWTEFQKQETRRQRLFVTYLLEKRHFFVAASYVHSLMLYKRLPLDAESEPRDHLYQSYNLRLMYDETPLDDRELAERIMMGYLEVISGINDQLDGGFQNLVDDALLIKDEIMGEWQQTVLQEGLQASAVIFQALDYEGAPTVCPQMVGQWFGLMTGHCFFDGIQVFDAAAQQTQMALQSLCCAITLKLLSLDKALARISRMAEDNSNEEFYLEVPAIMETIQGCIASASQVDSSAAYPAILVWSYIIIQLHRSFHERSERRDFLQQQRSAELLQADSAIRPTSTRRSSAGSIISIEVSPYDEFLKGSGLDREIQPIEALALQATSHGSVYTVLSEMAVQAGVSENGAFPPLLSWRIRATFLHFLVSTFPLVGYQSDPVSAALTVLSGGASYWDMSRNPGTQSLAAIALQDDRFLECYFQEALNRYPVELAPFLGLCLALGRSSATRTDSERQDLIVNLLWQTPTLTFNLPDAFQAYELVFEDENTNSFRLLEDLPLIIPDAQLRRHVGGDTFTLPAGTYGRFVTDSGRVVYMEYEHSALALMGRRLHTLLNRSDYFLVLGELEMDEAATIVGLLATLMQAETVKASSSSQAAAAPQRPTTRTALDILDEASQAIEGKDILSVVCDLLDTFMQNEAAMADGQMMSLLTACTQFLHATLPLCPSRVLSYMARCGLLNSDAQAGKLARLTGNLDMAADQFDFLISTIRLLSSVVDSIMTSAVRRKCGGKTWSRIGDNQEGWLGTSDKTLSKLGYAIAQTTVDVLENSSTWKFKSEVYPTLLMVDVVPIMNNLILYAHGVDDARNSNRPTACLEQGAGYVIDSFLSATTGSLRFQALLATVFTGYETRESTLRPGRALALQHQVSSVLELATTLLRVANLQDRPVNLVETYLFKSSCLLARLPGVNAHFTRPTLVLLDALVASAGKNCKEPPSLLGYLGPQAAKSFLDVLSRLDKPFCITQEVTTTWRFFSTIIRNNQQWLSNCLISGKTPREVPDTVKVQESSSDSVFSTALEKIKGLGADSAPPSKAQPEILAILDFVTSAQNYWPWTVFSILKDPACLDGLGAHLMRLSPTSLKAKNDPLGAAHEAKQAAYIAEAFAMQLYHLRHMGSAKATAEKLLKRLDYYLRDGTYVSGYNASLHMNFAKNFANKYPSCSVDSFKRTVLQPRDPGDNYYYDLERADEMLRFDPGWRGRKDNGFKTEMERANLNLSLVDAQVSLCHAWEFFLLELSSCLPSNEMMATHMHQVALQCLEANRDSQGPENIFVRIIHSRANFALQLIQRLVRVKISAPYLGELLASLYSSIISVEEPFDEDTISLYRTLLRALYINLAGLSARVKEAPNEVDGDSIVKMAQTSLSILDRVVGSGFRTLVTLVHDKDAAASSDDLSLIIAVLQACLAMPEMEQQQTQVLNIMAGYHAVHVACSLFSWSDKITVGDQDPIYGELSLMFLLELSKMPMIAEQLACDGIVGQLTSANLTQFMRKSAVSPLAEQTSAQRCYGIWSKALLPLLLNLLTSMGTTIAPEIAYVLNQFPGLLKSSVERFEGPGASRTSLGREAKHYVSLLAVAEVHSLALLTRVLAALRANNNRDTPEVKWDAASLSEYVEFWLTSRRILRERLLPIGQRETEWKGMRSTREGCENLLEEKVVGELEAVRDVLGEL